MNKHYGRVSSEMTLHHGGRFEFESEGWGHLSWTFLPILVNISKREGSIWKIDGDIVSTFGVTLKSSFLLSVIPLSPILNWRGRYLLYDLHAVFLVTSIVLSKSGEPSAPLPSFSLSRLPRWTIVSMKQWGQFCMCAWSPCYDYT